MSKFTIVCGEGKGRSSFGAEPETRSNTKQRTIKDIERHYTTLLELYTSTQHLVVDNEEPFTANELMINICEHAIAEAKYYQWSSDEAED